MTAQKKETFLKDYTPPAYLVDRVDLRVELDPRATVVQSRLQCRANTAAGGKLLPGRFVFALRLSAVLRYRASLTAPRSTSAMASSAVAASEKAE